jgi:hypothetical protein
MNYGNHYARRLDDQNPGTTTPTPEHCHAAPSFCRAERAKHCIMKPISSSNARDQIDAAIDQWAESLVAIIEASDNPEASLVRAHLAIATKHKELESMAWRELETRTQPSGNAHA